MQSVKPSGPSQAWTLPTGLPPLHILTNSITVCFNFAISPCFINWHFLVNMRLRGLLSLHRHIKCPTLPSVLGVLGAVSSGKKALSSQSSLFAGESDFILCSAALLLSIDGYLLEPTECGSPLSLGCHGQEGSYLIAGFSLLSRGTGLSRLTLRTTAQTVSSDPAALPSTGTPTASGKCACSPHLRGAPCSLASQAPRLLRAHPGKT